MSKTLKIVLGVLVIVIIIGIVAVAKNKTSETNNSEVIKVGVIAPLSSYMSEFGDATRNGFLLAQKEAINGKKVQFIFEDSVYDPKKAISAYDKLATIDKVDLIVDWGAATTQALASVVNRYDIPFVSISAVINAPSQSDKTVRFFERPDTFASKVWEHLRKLGLKNIAILKTQNYWLNSVYEQQVLQAKAGESVVLVDDVTSFNDMDFRTAVSKIKNSKTKYDAVGVYLGSGQIGQFYKQSSELGLKTVTFGTDFFENQSDIDTAGTAINGAFYPQYDVTPEFKAAYEKEYKNQSQIVYAGLAYDFANILMNSKDITSGKTALAHLKTLNNTPGVIGSYTYKVNATDSDKYMQIPVHIKEVRNSKIQTLY